MARIIPLWGSGLRGRADRTSPYYVRVNKTTREAHLVCLRHPVRYERFTERQKEHCRRWGKLVKGVSEWYRRITSPQASPEEQALVERLRKQIREQRRFSRVRGLVMAKYAALSPDARCVEICIGNYRTSVPVASDAPDA